MYWCIILAHAWPASRSAAALLHAIPLAALWADPVVWILRDPNTDVVEPFDLARGVLACYHVALARLLAHTVPGLVRIHILLHAYGTFRGILGAPKDCYADESITWMRLRADNRFRKTTTMFNCLVEPTRWDLEAIYTKPNSIA